MKVGDWVEIRRPEYLSGKRGQITGTGKDRRYIDRWNIRAGTEEVDIFKVSYRVPWKGRRITMQVNATEEELKALVVGR